MWLICGRYVVDRGRTCSAVVADTCLWSPRFRTCSKYLCDHATQVLVVVCSICGRRVVTVVEAWLKYDLCGRGVLEGC